MQVHIFMVWCHSVTWWLLPISLLYFRILNRIDKARPPLLTRTCNSNFLQTTSIYLGIYRYFFIEFKMKMIEFAKYKKVFLEKKWIPIVIFITFFLKNLINLQGAYFEEQWALKSFELNVLCNGFLNSIKIFGTVKIFLRNIRVFSFLSCQTCSFPQEITVFISWKVWKGQKWALSSIWAISSSWK